MPGLDLWSYLILWSPPDAMQLLLWRTSHVLKWKQIAERLEILNWYCCFLPFIVIFNWFLKYNVCFSDAKEKSTMPFWIFRNKYLLYKYDFFLMSVIKQCWTSDFILNVTGHTMWLLFKITLCFFFLRYYACVSISFLLILVISR